MKLQFTHKAYQAAAVHAVVDCFMGQPKQAGLTYRLDPGKKEGTDGQKEMDYQDNAFRNADLALPTEALLENVKSVQRGQNLTVSKNLVKTVNADVNLDVEMETGTGKTYVYIKTMFELHRRYGWSKFIIVVPSIAIREGIQKSLELTSAHFLQDYHKKARFFIYNSKQLHNLESFSSDAGINVMIINTQAFAARGKDQRRIYEELDDFQSRRPIDVIKANRPILILDEPQRMEGKKTQDSLKEFNPLFVLRYSATHKTTHNLVHRLDALDAYNQKLVKKIAVHGIAQKGLTGTDSYLYLEGLTLSRSKPVARLEFEIQSKSGHIKRTLRRISVGDNLFELSGELGQYQGYVVSDIDAIHDKIIFTNGKELPVGRVSGDLNEEALRRIQIREAIRAHLEKERELHEQGIKVLTLFFIDEVAKYRSYNEEGEEEAGEYAKVFEDEYNELLNEYLELGEDGFQKYLKGIAPKKTHNGYFAIDKKGRLIDPKVKAKGEDAGLTDDVSAYDLILKDKERLLSFAEPTRFLFSHSALREGWDNPNVFVICTLKHSENTVSRRQEVGRGMRLCVNQDGERLDDPATAHEINQLTVIANESYEVFVKGLQADIRDSLSSRPKMATESFFEGKVITDAEGQQVTIDKGLAKKIHRYLIKHDYIDEGDLITEEYHGAKENGTLAKLPPELEAYTDSLVVLIDTVFSDAAMPQIVDNRAAKENRLNENFQKKEFQELWKRINHRAAYTVAFDSEELVQKAIKAVNTNLRVAKLQFQLKKGQQEDEISQESLEAGKSFVLRAQETEYNAKSIQSTVSYDLIGEIAAHTQLTRRTVGSILQGLELPVFNQFRTNPEDFITQASRLIKEQKATAIIEHLAYDPVDERFDSTIFTSPKHADFSQAYKANNHIYDYVFTDSKGERTFVGNLDTSAEVTVYAKLPRGFSIPTPVGDYNPDWAIAFESGKVKHLYFIAETKGSMSSLQLREIEKAKIDCAKKFFAKITQDEVRYDVIESYDSLMSLLQD
ncbi:type III restriction-modification system endonuclease [Roseibacillus persicicus]|uniref:DEAD/DEAH box helicase n=1 Tax=Roseibacillus persicicus TaxID=454148 RepID=A0A918TEN7_9BACT|nr:DEAD/DEAH box helicase family protein [Roseibacillus persicicus]GHC41178.1 DEAD/DEAH box helicase [Roseibacillus persicicus]